MILTIAGTKKEYAAPLTVGQLIEAEQVENPLYVTVTVNDDFVPSAELDTHELHDGDEVEFLYFMGGGC